ncbi:MAG: acyl-CoA dehydrogenase family protein, partial [Acidobacteriota bacterium]
AFDEQATQVKLSNMITKLWVAWQAVLRAAELPDEGKPFKIPACIAKLFATEAAREICHDAVQLLSDYGDMDERLVKNYADVHQSTVGEGAILLPTIAESL